MGDKQQLFEMAHARVERQRAKMLACMAKGICPLCWENLAKWHDAPIIKQGRFWILTANDHPYSGAKHHHLAIYKDCVPSIADADPGAGDELLGMFADFCAKNAIAGASIVMRFGDMAFTGASIRHLHAHLISGVSRTEISEPIRYPDSFIAPVVGYRIPES